MNTYVVPKYNPQTGEGTLSDAARKAGVTLDQLLEANPQYKANPNSVQEGAQLNIPAAAAPAAPAAPSVDPNAKALAEQAGRAGVSVDDLNKILGRNTGLTQQDVDKIKESLGIPKLETDLFTAPSKTTEQLYQDAYVSAGLADVKGSIKKLNDDIAALEKRKSDIIGSINENPFLTEASRTGRIKRDTDRLNAEIATKQNQITAYTNLYNAGVAEVNNTVTRSVADTEKDQNRKAKQLEYLLKKAENQAEFIKSGKQAEINNYLPDYLRGKLDSGKPDTIGTAETGFYRWDAKTGKFIQVVPGTGKRTGENEQERQDVIDMGSQLTIVADSATGYVSPENYKKARNAWVGKSGRTAKSFDEAFANYRDPNLDYNIAL